MVQVYKKKTIRGLRIRQDTRYLHNLDKVIEAIGKYLSFLRIRIIWISVWCYIIYMLICKQRSSLFNNLKLFDCIVNYVISQAYLKILYIDESNFIV